MCHGNFKGRGAPPLTQRAVRSVWVNRRQSSAVETWGRDVKINERIVILSLK